MLSAVCEGCGGCGLLSCCFDIAAYFFCWFCTAEECFLYFPVGITVILSRVVGVGDFYGAIRHRGVKRVHISLFASLRVISDRLPSTGIFVF